MTALPGQGVAARVLMFVLGSCGVFAGLFIGVLHLIVDAPNVVLVFLPLGYGAFSITLAALMRRRRKGVFRSVVGFVVAAALFSLFFIVMGDSSWWVPLILHTVMTGLMFTPRVRAYYGL
ncbi:hypothetical protein [Nocardiopsis sp. JB363]|uniref:hypothetical protein n=1 Tax=Nocardiopsis sp. JB363 TaxID=1434837 RepID=UPI00097A6118|nr:hypothetical protein [Nocardiopsis sp. JB363]SIO86261.1 hypothetical protein BQ8420_11100 [Nocardiopsis sp. JB363]